MLRQEEFQAAQISQMNRQHRLAQKAQAQSEKAARAGMGIEAGKLGSTIAMRHQGSTLGSMGTQTRSLFGGSGTGTGLGGFVDQFSMGSFIGGGLAGYGASKLAGKKKNKATKALYGAGAGAAIGLLSGGVSGGIAGGVAGALGSLF